MWSFFIQNFWLFRPFVVILTCGVALYFAFRVLTKHLIRGAAKSEQNQPFDFDLTELEDLRASGALSPDEYDRIKAIALMKRTSSSEPAKGFPLHPRNTDSSKVD